MTKFILTSPTGHLGSRVLAAILQHNLIPPSDLIICTASPDDSRISSAAKDANIEIRTNVNFTSTPSSIAPKFTGGDVLFLSSYPSPSISRWQYHKNAIDAAILAGVTTIIYTSLMFGGETGMESVAGVQQAHIKTIRYLEEETQKIEKEGREFGFVVVREGIYAESWWLYAGYQPAAGVLRREGLERKVEEGGGVWEWVVPSDGEVAWVGWGDLGEGTARIVARWREFVGRSVRLTGPRATRVSDVARIAAEETGVEVGLRCVGADEACEWHKKRKSAGEGGEWVVESWSGWYKALEQGECAVVDPLLGELLGRQPKGVEELRGELFKLAG